MEVVAQDWLVVRVPETQHPKLTERPLLVTGLEIATISAPPAGIRGARDCPTATCAALQAWGFLGERIACKPIAKKDQGSYKKRDKVWREPEGWTTFIKSPQHTLGFAEVACPIA